MIRVIVRDRREGKTTELIKWLLEGKQIRLYPGWSRIIVCPLEKEVIRVTDEVRRETGAEGWGFEEDQILVPTHILGESIYRMQYDRALNDVRKAVWSLRDLRYNLIGVGPQEFEYALDDADYYFSTYTYREGLSRPPAVIAMTGELYDHVRD